MSDSAPQFRTDGHALICDGRRFAVCDAPDAAVTLARICNCHEALVEALEDMLNIFDREGSAPRKLASGEVCLSIGARTCDSARAALAHTAQGDV